jgi:hypothetical protein
MISVIADGDDTSIGAQINIGLATRIAEADTVPAGHFNMRLRSIGTRSERYFTCQRAKKSRLHVVCGYQAVWWNTTAHARTVHVVGMLHPTW